MENILFILPGLALIGFIFMFLKSSWVSKQEEGTDKMKVIAKLKSLWVEIRYYSYTRPLAFIKKTTNMKKYRSGIMALAVVLIIVQLIIIDFDDLSWSNNTGSYLGVFSMALLILAMIASNRAEKEWKQKAVKTG